MIARRTAAKYRDELGIHLDALVPAACKIHS